MGLGLWLRLGFTIRARVDAKVRVKVLGSAKAGQGCG